MEPRFLCDSMLGKLARWLSLLGYDSRFAGVGRSDQELLEEARREGRIFITRDTKIPEVRSLRKIVLKEQRFEDQLKRVLKETGLKPDPDRFFSRCTLCNALLEALPRQEALALVPPKVRELDTKFFRCSKCRHVYWIGTHVENTLRKLKCAGF